MTSLKEKIPTLDSLLAILSEHVPHYAKNALPTITVPQQLQTLTDEFVPPPILVPKLHMTKSPPALPYRSTPMEPSAPMEPQPSTSTSNEYKSGPISLEMFNHAATDLNNKGVYKHEKILEISPQAVKQ